MNQLLITQPTLSLSLSLFPLSPFLLFVMRNRNLILNLLERHKRVGFAIARKVRRRMSAGGEGGAIGQWGNGGGERGSGTFGPELGFFGEE